MVVLFGARAVPRSRTGRVASLVPTARLELAQLSPLPPQDSVSTNFTTSAQRSREPREPHLPGKGRQAQALEQPQILVFFVRATVVASTRTAAHCRCNRRRAARDPRVSVMSRRRGRC